MLGLTVTLGTSKREITAHSGLHVFVFIPIFFNSSSLILTNLSLTSIGLNLFFPIMNVLGFSNLIFSIISLQYGHFFMSLAFLAFILVLNPFCFSSERVNFPQAGQKLLKHNSINGIYFILNNCFFNS